MAWLSLLLFFFQEGIITICEGIRIIFACLDVLLYFWGNCKASLLLNSNSENDSLFWTLQNRSTFFNLKKAVGLIPFRSFNGVK
jgi:hypothetical protein